MRNHQRLRSLLFMQLASVGLSALTSLDLGDSYEECFSLQPDDGLKVLSLGDLPALWVTEAGTLRGLPS
jgi:hypothetical protein